MTLHYQGWTRRPVIVTVSDANTGHAVSDAAVKLAPDDDMQRFLDNTANDKKKYDDVTGPDGRAELLIWFHCGGERSRWLFFLSDKGKFSLEGAGTLHVDAQGYEPFERELFLLTDEHRRSVNDKSPVEVSVKLTVLLPVDDAATLEADSLKTTGAIKLKLESTDIQPPQILEVRHGDLP